MTIIKVPAMAAVSVVTGKELQFDTATRMFSDEHGEIGGIDHFVTSDEANPLRKWLDENYPSGA